MKQASGYLKMQKYPGAFVFCCCEYHESESIEGEKNS